MPYAFGGDGATLLIPERLLPTVMETLENVQQKVADMFDLELRAGCVSLRALYRHDVVLSVGRFYLSSQLFL